MIMSHPVDGGVQPTVARSSSQHAGESVHNAHDSLQCVASFCGGVVVMTASPPGHYHAKPPLPPSPTNVGDARVIAALLPSLDPSDTKWPSADLPAAGDRTQRIRVCRLSRLEKLCSGPKFASPLKVAAMETVGSDAAITYPERDCDLEHLPPLLEDEVRTLLSYEQLKSLWLKQVCWLIARLHFSWK